MTQGDLLIVTRWTIAQLATFCRRRSPQHVMDFRRELQKAVADYRKRNKYDAVCDKALAITGKIEKWMRSAFVEREMVRVIRGNPTLSPRAAKNKAREAWETYHREHSY